MLRALASGFPLGCATAWTRATEMQLAWTLPDLPSFRYSSDLPSFSGHAGVRSWSRHRSWSENELGGVHALEEFTVVGAAQQT